MTIRPRRLGVVIFSDYPQELYARELLERGASDFVHKNFDPEQIIQAVRAAAARRLRAVAGAAA